MNPVSTDPTQSTTKKRPKINRSPLVISKKVVAFQELISLKKTRKSKREVSSLLEIPNSTMQTWVLNHKIQETQELSDFFLTPTGAMWLERVVMAAYYTIHFGCGGIGGLQEFLQLSNLSQFVACSEGSLHKFSVRCENYIVAFGGAQEHQLSKTMKQRKITAGLDEMFRGSHPCLVAIEVVSGFILLEKFTKDRKAETWAQELKPRLDSLNVELGQVVSDLCGGIRAAASELKAQHVPELFHAQYEISKATSAPLAAQEKEFEKLLEKAEILCEKTVKRQGEESEQAKEAMTTRNCRRYGLEQRRERRQKVRKAKKELGKIHHPINLTTGKLQKAEEVKARFDEQLNIIETAAKEAVLSKSCHKRLDKARRAFDGVVVFVKSFFVFLATSIKGLHLSFEQESFFNEVIFPLCYLKMIWRRFTREERKELQWLIDSLEAKARDGPWSNGLKEEWMKKGRELAEFFQRSSSCVEGRNGMLSLYYHRFHRLNVRGLKALTIVHNFHTRRDDQTTAAERFFGRKHDDLFESLLANVRIPGKPQRQYHDPEKRRLGWLKRIAA